MNEYLNVLNISLNISGLTLVKSINSYNLLYICKFIFIAPIQHGFGHWNITRLCQCTSAYFSSLSFVTVLLFKITRYSMMQVWFSWRHWKVCSRLVRAKFEDLSICCQKILLILWSLIWWLSSRFLTLFKITMMVSTLFTVCILVIHLWSYLLSHVRVVKLVQKALSQINQSLVNLHSAVYATLSKTT